MDALAVLFSGGLDSAILIGEALRRGQGVHPLYVRCGLFWEAAEFEAMRRFLKAMARPALQPLTILDQPVADLYGHHWSVTGEGIPAAGTPDEAVFVPGRNVLLLGKAMLWCHLHQFPAVAVGSLGTNPFPDASPAFFAALQNTVNMAVQGNVAVQLPFAGMKKTEVMRLGRGLPLELSFSCINPRNGRHCGRCNKCAERKQAFANAGMTDPTLYC
jgi:7-cyano-7-deazaguanine synthase